MVRAAASASPLKWCIEGLCCAELRGLELDRASLSQAPNPNPNANPNANANANANPNPNPNPYQVRLRRRATPAR